MKNARFLAALLLTLPFAAAAQTRNTTPPAAPVKTTPTATPTPGTQQQTEVTEDLDPVTGKVIRRTTRTINVPVGTPASTAPRRSDSTYAASSVATDAQVTAFLRKKTAVAALTAPALLDAYQRFMDRVHADRHSWKTTDWTAASAVLSRLNGRYDQLRASFSLDDKFTIRTQQAEFQALRTGRQLSDQVSDKL